MKLVERRVESYDGNRSEGSRDARAVPARAYSAQNQQTQNEILGEMRTFADDVMNFKKGGRRRVRHQPVENRNNDSARIVRRKSRS